MQFRDVSHIPRPMGGGWHKERPLKENDDEEFAWI